MRTVSTVWAYILATNAIVSVCDGDIKVDCHGLQLCYATPSDEPEVDPNAWLTSGQGLRPALNVWDLDPPSCGHCEAQWRPVTVSLDVAITDGHDGVPRQEIRPHTVDTVRIG